MNEILKFIAGFSEVKNFFLYGYCYWFARILCERFDMQLYYLPVSNHFVAYKNWTFYDANGVYKIGNEKPIFWETYKEIDPVHYARIERDCIRKE